MVNPFIAEIMMFGGNFAIRAWALCDGQLLAISSNTALFSLLGTTYGGDGRTTFALPDMRGRAAIHPGNGPGLSYYSLGEKGGVEDVTLDITQIPNHSHFIENKFASTPNTADPTNAYPANLGPTNTVFGTTPSGDMGESVVSNTGNGLDHENLRPFLCVNYLIAMFGVYPSRS